jgi:uncharacterized protein
MTVHDFKPSWWLPGPHLQTLWGRFFRRTPPLRPRHERWDTADGDVVDVYRVPGKAGSPHLLLLHGLEGGLRSHYARGLLAGAAHRGWSATLLVFRSCGPELNRLPRFYHSGDTVDARMAIGRVLTEAEGAPLLVAGVSLGGNVLLRLLAEEGGRAAGRIAAAAALSVPYDLFRSARHIQRGFARVYEQHFVRSLRRKALAKLERHHGIYDGAAVRRARTLFEFDDVVTAPLHGFADAADYYARASSLPVLDRIAVPTLLVSAEDDPFLPGSVLAEVRAAAARNPNLHLLFVPFGGHVGFISGPPWRQVYWGEARAFDFFEAQLADAAVREPVASLTGGAA